MSSTRMTRMLGRVAADRRRGEQQIIRKSNGAAALVTMRPGKRFTLPAYRARPERQRTETTLTLEERVSSLTRLHLNAWRSLDFPGQRCGFRFDPRRDRTVQHQ